MTYKFSEDFVNKLAHYLGTKPYAEVALLMQEIGKAIKAEEKPTTKDSAEGK